MFSVPCAESGRVEGWMHGGCWRLGYVDNCNLTLKSINYDNTLQMWVSPQERVAVILFQCISSVYAAPSAAPIRTLVPTSPKVLFNIAVNHQPYLTAQLARCKPEPEPPKFQCRLP